MHQIDKGNHQLVSPTNCSDLITLVGWLKVVDPLINTLRPTTVIDTQYNINHLINNKR